MIHPAFESGRLADAKGIAYLLMYLGVPSDRLPSPDRASLKCVDSARRAGAASGFEVWPAALVGKDSPAHFRYFFSLPDGSRDDGSAIRFAESILYAARLIKGPMFEAFRLPLAFPLPTELLADGRILETESLVRVVADGALGEWELNGLRSDLNTVWYFEDAAVDMAWSFAPLVFGKRNFYDALRFLMASQDRWHVWPGEVDGVLARPGVPITGAEQNIFEDALLNDYKAVEAILGDLPADDRRLGAKLHAIGEDPDEDVGYDHQMSLLTALREMNDARDKRAAHGSTRNRTITTRDLMDFQMLAQRTVWGALEHELGTP
jgi:hypothetical protein